MNLLHLEQTYYMYITNMGAHEHALISIVLIKLHECDIQ